MKTREACVEAHGVLKGIRFRLANGSHWADRIDKALTKIEDALAGPPQPTGPAVGPEPFQHGDVFFWYDGEYYSPAPRNDRSNLPPEVYNRLALGEEDGAQHLREYESREEALVDYEQAVIHGNHVGNPGAAEAILATWPEWKRKYLPKAKPVDPVKRLAASVAEVYAKWQPSEGSAGFTWFAPKQPDDLPPDVYAELRRGKVTRADGDEDSPELWRDYKTEAKAYRDLFEALRRLGEAHQQHPEGDGAVVVE